MEGKFVKYIIVILAVVLTTGVMSGCKDKDTKKKIILSKDVLKEDLENDKKGAQLIISRDANTKLVKLKEFNEIPKGVEPICWKDDNNIVLVDTYSIKNELRIYNLNINSGKVTVKAEVKDAALLNGAELYGSRSWNYKPSTILFYVKDYKLWVYNLLDDNKREVYDLYGIKVELEKLRVDDKEFRKIEKGSDFTSNLYGHGFLDIELVQGSSRYALIKIWSFATIPERRLYDTRILDLDTGEELELPSVIREKMYYESSIVYSKINDRLYLFPLGDEIDFMVSKPFDNNKKGAEFEGIYEFKLGEDESFKKIKKTQFLAKSPVISEDGRYIYFFSENCDEKTRTINDKRIIKYNIDYGTFTTVFDSYSEGYFYIYKFNYNNNMVLYHHEAGVIDHTYKYVYELAFAKGNTLNTIGESENLQDGSQSGFGYFIFNREGNKFINFSEPVYDADFQLVSKLRFELYELEGIN